MEESGYAGFIMLIEVYFRNKVRDCVGVGEHQRPWGGTGQIGREALEVGLEALACQSSSEAEARIMVPTRAAYGNPNRMKSRNKNRLS